MEKDRFRRIVESLMQYERGELPEHVRLEALSALKGDVPEQHAKDIDVLVKWHRFSPVPDDKSFNELTRGTSSLVKASLDSWYKTQKEFEQYTIEKYRRKTRQRLVADHQQLRKDSEAVSPEVERKREAAIQQDPFDKLNITVLSEGIKALQGRGANITFEQLKQKVIHLRRSGVRPTEEHVIRELAAEHGVKPPVIRKTKKPE